MSAEDKITEYLSPKRIAFSRRHPFLKPPILFAKRSIRWLAYRLDPRISSDRDPEPFRYVMARHSSPLIRTLGKSPLRLQEQKDEKLYDNFAPVRYPVTDEYLKEHAYTVLRT